MSTRKSTVFYGFMIALVSVVVGMVIAARLDLAPRSFGAVNVPATNSEPVTGPIDATTFRRIAQETSPAVVSIITQSTRRGRTLADLFGLDQPGGRGQGDAVPQRGAGSGFIVDKAGYILTNNHVVADADQIEVKLLGMSDLATVPGLPATVVGRDELTDSALIKLDELPEEPLVEAKFGDSEQIAPGDWVMAIGNPYSLSNTVTVGVVSAVGRPQETQFANRFEKMIQTDAAINRGNSGGPLLNLRGEVVGINTMILSDQGSGNLGIGFSVPINTVRDILPQLRTGKVVRGVLGVSVSRAPITAAYARDLGLPSTAGAEVSRITEGGPAARGGLQVGDVIIEFNGEPVPNDEGLVRMVMATKPGSTVPVKIIRDRKAVTLNVTVDELDLEAEQAPLRATPTPRGREREPQPIETDFGMVLREPTARERRQLSVPEGQGGAVVESVEPLGPANLAGLQPGDVILQIGGSETRTVDQVTQALGAIGDSRVVRIIAWRANPDGTGGERQLFQLRRR
ncbi:MAG: trypsin-like peptidase domain-containing protein [Vicinamibacterales bacterium]